MLNKSFKIFGILTFLSAVVFSQSAFAYGSQRDCRFQSRYYQAHRHHHRIDRFDRFDRLSFNTAVASPNGFVLVVNSGQRHSHYVPSCRARVRPVCRFNDC